MYFGSIGSDIRGDFCGHSPHLGLDSQVNSFQTSGSSFELGDSSWPEADLVEVYWMSSSWTGCASSSEPKSHRSC